MEKDTVLLNVEKYNELRDFKKEIEDGNFLVTEKSWGGMFSGNRITKYYTESEIAKELTERNKELLEEKEALNKEIKEIKEKLGKRDEPKVITISDIKRMSAREFRRWKKS